MKGNLSVAPVQKLSKIWIFAGAVIFIAVMVFIKRIVAPALASELGFLGTIIFIGAGIGVANLYERRKRY
jgi:hypothetical protein